MPLPALELSRDDMRYLLENTLNVHLLGWEQVKCKHVMVGCSHVVRLFTSTIFM